MTVPRAPISGVTGVPRAAAAAAPNKTAQGQEKPATGRKKVGGTQTSSQTPLRSALHDRMEKTASTRHKAKVTKLIFVPINLYQHQQD